MTQCNWCGQESNVMQAGNACHTCGLGAMEAVDQDSRADYYASVDEDREQQDE